MAIVVDNFPEFLRHPSFRATPAKAGGDPESRKIANLDAGFRRHDDVKPPTCFANFRAATRVGRQQKVFLLRSC